MDINISNLAMQFGSHNTHDLFDWVTGVLTSIAPLVAIWVSWLLAKKEIRNSESHFNKQLELQRLQWKNYSFFKYKQDKLLDFRTKFLTFEKDTIEFLQLFLPDKIIIPSELQHSGNKKGDYTILKINNNPEEIIKKYCKNSNDLLSFIENNDIFINDNPMLITYVKTMVRAFKEFYTELNRNKSFESLFVKQDNNYISNPQNIAFRILFFNFMRYRLGIDLNGVATSMFYAIPNSVFALYKLSFDTENMRNWVGNEEIMFGAFGIFSTYLQTWKQTIDNLFSSALKEIEKYFNVADIDIDKVYLETNNAK